MVIAPSLDETYGALFVGVACAIFLFGVITVQTYGYYVAFPHDRPALHFLVATVWILELIHTGGIAYEIYIIVTSRDVYVTAFPGLGVALLVGGLVTMLAQIFFARRLWKLIPRPYNFVGLVSIFLAVVRAGGSTFLASKAITSIDLPKFLREWEWLITTLLSVGAALDVVIAVAMLSFLMVTRNESLGHFARIIDRLVAYTIRTGAFTSVAAIVVLICFQVIPGTFVWIGIYAFLAKLYSNSLLAALMERRQLRNAVGNSDSGKASIPLSRRYTANTYSSKRSTPPQPLHVKTLSLRQSGAQVLSIDSRHSASRRGDTGSGGSGYWHPLERFDSIPDSPPPESPQSPSRVYYGKVEKPLYGPSPPTPSPMTRF